MKPTSLALGLLAVLLALPRPAAAQRTLTDAELVGRYAFAIGLHADASGTTMRVVGVITADGTGNVVGGSRTVFRHESFMQQALQYTQTASGTYRVEPDGTGTMLLTWSPTLPGVAWESAPVAPPCRNVHQDPNETLTFSLHDAGFELVHEVRSTHVHDCPPPWHGDNGTVQLPPSIVQGFAVKQDAPCRSENADVDAARVPGRLRR
jgi:hypothetical protein